VAESSRSGAESAEVLAPAVLDHLVSDELMATAERLLPPSKLKAFVRARLPGTLILRKGVFGEVLSVRLLEEFHGLVVPIKKLRYRTASYDSPKATDVLAIKVNDQGEIIEVAYVEAKVRTTRSKIDQIAAVAHDQLQKDCKAEIPEIMGFAAEVLSGRNDPLVESIMAYLRRRDAEEIDTHHIFLVVDKGCWRESDLDCLVEHQSLLVPLDVHIVAIDALAGKVDLVYGLVGAEAMPDDD
jgi:hypothetical protein